MYREKIFNAVKDGFGNRRYAAGLCISFIDLLRHLGLPRDDINNSKDFYVAFPRQEWRAVGKPANQLVVDIGGGKTVGLRGFYNTIEAFFRAKHKRFDYPSCPGHATQSWRDYGDWLDMMCQMDDQDLLLLRQEICDFVLDVLPSQAFDPDTLVREPPILEMVINGFDLSKHKGELTGAAYQGLVFGFLRADNPHLQVEIDKVRTGTKRLQRVGDVDAWEGARLAITAEVKQYVLKATDVDQLAAFANEAGSRGSIGIVFSLGFEEGVRDAVEGLGVRGLDIGDLENIVSLWDPMKQRTAVASMTYYVKHVEKSSALGNRLDDFLASALASFNPV